jgi:ComF family protein
MAGPLGALIAASIQADPELQADTLVPVPLHPSRRRERGFNQAELLARQVARGRGLRCEAGLLRRRLPTASQSGLSRSARQANVRETFTASGRVHGRSILLVDDVISTGSTASACAQALLAAGAADVVVAVVAQAVLAR